MGILTAILVLGVLGAILGIAIGVCSKIFYVEVDERQEKIQAMLPGVNCGACGYAGCSGLAEAIVENGAKPELCKPGTAEMRANIKKFLEDYKKSKEAE